MTDNKWRKELDILIDKNISELLKETKEYDYAISKAKNKSKAQMWIALGIINHKLNLILNEKEYKKKLKKEEVEDILNKLEKL